jgi:2-hydroxy-3-keto-5-methylthiopentenyl-1-phosphate phosphatase
LDRFADPRWRQIEERWEQGIITARECMQSEAELISATPEEIEEFAARIRIDPYFALFVQACRRSGFVTRVVSDGFDLVVARVLRGAGLDLAFAANKLIWRGGRSWTLEPRAPRADCPQRMANCKCQQRIAGATHVMIGDGRSDFCIARHADLVLAKHRLAELCQRWNVPHVPIANFSEALGALKSWIATRENRMASPASDVMNEPLDAVRTPTAKLPAWKSRAV